MITLNIIRFTEESDWDIGSAHRELTGHIYYGSAIESADSCGTCDGAKCDCCHEVLTNEILEFSCESDKLKEYLIRAGAPEEIASEFAYSDFVGSHYKGYYFPWPSCEELKSVKPDLYERLTTMDQEILTEIQSELPNYKIFGDMKDAILRKHDVGRYDHTSFIEKQLNLFWKMNGETHDIFKMPNERFRIGNFGYTEYVFTNPNADEEVRETRRHQLGRLRSHKNEMNPGCWICYCIERGVWRTGQIKSITDDHFDLESGLIVLYTDLLTDVHRIEDFNAERYNGFQDDRLKPRTTNMSVF